MGSDQLPVFSIKRTIINGLTVDARISDTAHPVSIILISGIGVSERYFRRLAGELCLVYNVIGINLPGYGDTIKPPHALNLAEMTNLVSQFIVHEKIDNLVVIGQSMGCQIAARLSVTYPEIVSKMILIAPTINARERTALLQFFRLIQDAFHEPLAMNRIAITDYMKFGFLRFLKTQRYMIADTIEVSLASCTKPTMILRGERDKIVPREWVNRLLSLLGNGSAAEITSAPHNAQFTHPKHVARVCRDFIDT